MEKEKFFEKPRKEEEKEEKIKTPEIRDLKEPMENLVDLLRENIEKGEYSSVLGDDASGRIPTLIFYKTINKIYNEQDRKPIECLFLHGRSAKKLSKKEVDDYISKIKNRLGKKALLVTDTIYSGETVEAISKIFKKNEILHDIATIVVHTGGEGMFSKVKHKKETPVAILKKTKTPVFWGKKGVNPEIYRKPHLSGVARRKESIVARPWPFKDMVQLKQAREDAEILSDELVEYYFEKTKNK